MYDQNVLHIQWLSLAIFGGISLLFVFILSFLDYWRPRQTEHVVIGEDAPVHEKWKAAGYTIPWILILTFVLTFVLTIIYTILKIYFPPNW